MATIIIQGTQIDTIKTLNVLKEKFPIFEKKAVLKCDDVLTTIVEAYAEDFELKEYSAEETLKALSCCTHIDRDCSNCPYRKIKNCKERVLIDGAVVVQRMYK